MGPAWDLLALYWLANAIVAVQGVQLAKLMSALSLTHTTATFCCTVPPTAEVQGVQLARPGQFSAGFSVFLGVQSKMSVKL